MSVCMSVYFRYERLSLLHGKLVFVSGLFLILLSVGGMTYTTIFLVAANNAIKTFVDEVIMQAFMCSHLLSSQRPDDCTFDIHTEETYRVEISPKP